MPFVDRGPLNEGAVGENEAIFQKLRLSSLIKKFRNEIQITSTLLTCHLSLVTCHLSLVTCTYQDFAILKLFGVSIKNLTSPRGAFAPKNQHTQMFHFCGDTL